VTYDVNGDNQLSKDENRVLMAHFLKELSKELPAFFKDTIDVMIESTTRDLSPAEEREFKSFSADLSKQMRKELEIMLRDMVKNSREIADQLHERMDVNHDGVVDLSEFTRKFNLELKSVFRSCFSVDAVLSRLNQGS